VIDLLLAPDMLPFSGALVLMLLIGLLMAFGLGDFVDGVDTDIDTGIGGDVTAGGDGLLALLGFGRLPLMMLLVLFLAVFGLVGLVGQQLAVAATGATLTAWIAGPAAAMLAGPMTGALARPIARILPHDETSAIDRDALIGRFGRIQLGTAASGSPARAEVKDGYGLVHLVMVEPDNADQQLREGEEIILVRRENELFKAISRGTMYLPRLD